MCLSWNDEPALSPAQLYETHWRPLMAFAGARGCGIQDAEDVVQDMFVSLVRTGRIHDLARLPQGDQTAMLRQRLTWLLIKGWHRRERQRRDPQWAVPVAELDDAGLPDITQATPAEQLDRAWATQVIEQALSGLRASVGEHRWSVLESALRGDACDDGAGGPATSCQRVALCRARKHLRAVLPRDDLQAAFRSQSSHC